MRLPYYAFVFFLGVATAFHPPTFLVNGPNTGQSIAQFLAVGDQENDENVEVTRRDAIKKTVVEGSLLAAALASGAAPSFARTVATQVAILEKENIATVNSNGAPEKHLPQVAVSDSGTVEVVVPHVMDPEKPHWIQAIWLKDEATGKVAAAEMFPSTAPSPPTLKYSGSTSGTFTPFLYCNLHGLWKGDSFTV